MVVFLIFVNFVYYYPWLARGRSANCE